ncbi:MAG: helix-turn-helix transcriptional regulator [Bacilli bacterium]|nr:helix-turn-helix transcriptional regulator [Clostridia bacterium]MBR4619329.1 helix-turn-helix transcriptional regulator [Bacilli bacterium]
MNKDLELRKQMGERVRKIRNEMKLTKEALGKKLGVTGQFLGVVESGKSDISYDKLKKLCDISGYSADYILFGRNSKSIVEAKSKLEQYTDDQIIEACDVIKRIAIFMKKDL